MAVAQARGYSSNSTLSLGTSICPDVALKRQKQKEEEEKKIAMSICKFKTIIFELHTLQEGSQLSV